MVWIKRFFEHQSGRGVISSAELIAFKRACTEPEWEHYTKAAQAFFEPQAA